jgi:UDP-N-acetylglucosamine--dolichyl-phosphate N-acetylglucosaminephosphotransferase
MINAVLILPLIVSFFITFLFIPLWIKKAKQIGLIWEDMNKYPKAKNVAGSGGIIVILGFILGILFYISIKTFYFKTSFNVLEIFALSTSILILAMTGLIDDLFGWWHGGLSKKFRILMCIFAAIPLIVINAGNSEIMLPIFGLVNVGILYSLFFIPLGVVTAATSFNFLAGFNGLEAGQGAIILTSLSLVAFFTSYTWVALLGLCMFASLLAFLIFNKFPAKVFPGDILTYSVGGMIAIMAILANMERIALFFFIPYIIEMVLKLRGGLKKQSFGKPNKENSLEMPYDKIYGLEHFSIWFLKKTNKNNKVYEKDVVYFIHIIQIVVIILGIIIFKKSIFI